MSNYVECQSCGETYTDKYEHNCDPQNIATFARRNSDALEERIEILERSVEVLFAMNRIARGNGTAGDFILIAEVEEGQK